MKALLVIDVQNGIVKLGDFKEELLLMEHVMKDFKENNLPVIFIRHLDADVQSSLHKDSIGSELHISLKGSC